MKEQVVLEREMETLLIPLYGRAKMSEQGISKDFYAQKTVAAIDYDFGRLRIQKKLQIFMAIRSNLIDDHTETFLAHHPRALVISLGSGLDARYARVKGYREWVDLDFPQVVALREKLLPQQEHHQSIGSSVTDGSWIDEMEATEESVLVIAEGLLMYLSQTEVGTLLNRMTSKFPNMTLIFDAYSNLTVRKITGHSSLRKTGATIRWGMDAPEELETLCQKLQYEKTIYLTERKYTQGLDFVYRSMFKFAGEFKMAKEAHRIFVFHTK